MYKGVSKNEIKRDSNKVKEEKAGLNQREENNLVTISE